MPTASCPHADERKSAGGPGVTGPLVIRDMALARQLLRAAGTRQAGFKAELIERFSGKRHAPVLFQEGETHQKQRSATARFFAPKVVTTRYRLLMEELSARLVSRLKTDGNARLDDMSLAMGVAVAGEIVGLTDSIRPGMAGRLNKFFMAPEPHNWLQAFAGFLLGQWRMLAFYICDVRPAIRARRAAPRQDVISHLIGQGYSDREILTECFTYGAAGMATTREFIVMAAWHLLERDALRAQFLAGDEAGRVAILEEILRLEPVVGALYRRTGQELTLDDRGTPLVIPQGSLVALDVRGINADAAGACPHQLDAARERPAPGQSASGLSFGDGPHRCPGATVALQETAIFLDALLRLPGIRLAQAPAMTFNPLIASYELRGAQVAVDRSN